MQGWEPYLLTTHLYSNIIHIQLINALHQPWEALNWKVYNFWLCHDSWWPNINSSSLGASHNARIHHAWIWFLTPPTSQKVASQQCQQPPTTMARIRSLNRLIPDLLCDLLLLRLIMLDVFLYRPPWRTPSPKAATPRPMCNMLTIRIIQQARWCAHKLPYKGLITRVVTGGLQKQNMNDIAW